MTVAPGSPCSVTGVTADGAGSTFTVTLSLTFLASFGGDQVVYAAVRDLAGNNSGWQAMGTWQVPFTPPAGPTVTGLSNGTFTFAGATSYQDLSVLNVLIADAVDARNACYVAFDMQSRSLFLVDDAGDVGGPYQGLRFGQQGSISNSQCTIGGFTEYVSDQKSVALTLGVSFSGSFRGHHVIYAAARGAGTTSGWQAVGTVAVP
jgi:hypothetical protein